MAAQFGGRVIRRREFFQPGMGITSEHGRESHARARHKPGGASGSSGVRGLSVTPVSRVHPCCFLVPGLADAAGSSGADVLGEMADAACPVAGGVPPDSCGAFAGEPVQLELVHVCLLTRVRAGGCGVSGVGQERTSAVGRATLAASSRFLPWEGLCRIPRRLVMASGRSISSRIRSSLRRRTIRRPKLRCLGV